MGPVREALAEWLTYKRERGESYKPTGLRAILTETENKIDRYGENAVIAVIRQSIANGWKGIIWDKLGGADGYARQEKPFGGNRRTIIINRHGEDTQDAAQGGLILGKQQNFENGFHRYP